LPIAGRRGYPGFEGRRARFGAVVLGGDAGVGVLEPQRRVDPDAVSEPHRGPAASAGAVGGEHVQRDVRRERGVGGAAGGAEEGDDLVERGAPRAGAEERQRRVEGERGDGQVGARAVAGSDAAEHAQGEGGHIPGGRRVLHGERRWVGRGRPAA
jgi:hypothetical protein